MIRKNLCYSKYLVKEFMLLKVYGKFRTPKQHFVSPCWSVTHQMVKTPSGFGSPKEHFFYLGLSPSLSPTYQMVKPRKPHLVWFWNPEGTFCLSVGLPAGHPSNGENSSQLMHWIAIFHAVLYLTSKNEIGIVP